MTCQCLEHLCVINKLLGQDHTWVDPEASVSLGLRASGMRALALQPGRSMISVLSGNRDSLAAQLMS